MFFLCLEKKEYYALYSIIIFFISFHYEFASMNVEQNMHSFNFSIEFTSVHIQIQFVHTCMYIHVSDVSSYKENEVEKVAFEIGSDGCCVFKTE